VTQKAENGGYNCPESPAYKSCNSHKPCPCEESLSSMEGGVVKNPEEDKVYYIAGGKRYLVPKEMCESFITETEDFGEHSKVDKGRNFCKEIRLEDKCVEHKSWPLGGNYIAKLSLNSRRFCKDRQNEINMGVEAAYAMKLAYEVEEGMSMKKGDILDFGWKALENYSGGEQGGWRALVWEKSDTCLVSFKGSSSFGNWALANILADPKKIGNANVHAGFYMMTMFASKKLKELFGQGKHCSGKKVVVTGHSLGAAVAEIFSWALLSGRLDLQKRRKADVTTITFAQPQTFLKQKTLWWTDNDCPSEIYNNPRSYRYVLTAERAGELRYDPLPHLQLPTLAQAATSIPNIFGDYHFKHCNKGIQIQIDHNFANGLKIFKVHDKNNWPTGKDEFQFLWTSTNVAALDMLALHMQHRYKRAMDANGYDGTCKTNYN